jgi:hypothetical protein
VEDSGSGSWLFSCRAALGVDRELSRLERSDHDSMERRSRTYLETMASAMDKRAGIARLETGGEILSRITSD